MRKKGILCACEKELKPYIADMQDISTTEYAMHTFYHGDIKGRKFRDTNNEIYSDFPIMESPIFYADDYLLEVAKSAAIQADWKIHFGLATTGDIFTKNISPNALCIDMETAAAAHTCYMCNVPFIAIRSISDNKADNGQEAINRNFDKAAYQSCRFVEMMLPMISYVEE